MSTEKNADVEFIKALAQILRDNDLTEVEVTRDDGEEQELKVRLARQIQVAQVIAAPAAMAAPVAAAPAGAPVAAPEDPALHPGALTSPMVGTVYLAAEPTAPNFVNVGDNVAEGQTVLIVEAMKTMNQIPSPRAGVIKRILVEDGQSVEFGAPLVIVE
jgi:acetyl-CoA carboxylase biotin carboxyl carrier protein